MYLIPIGHVFDTNRACIKKDLFVVLVNEKKREKEKMRKKVTKIESLLITIK